MTNEKMNVTMMYIFFVGTILLCVNAMFAEYNPIYVGKCEQQNATHINQYTGEGMVIATDVQRNIVGVNCKEVICRYEPEKQPYLCGLKKWGE